MSDKIILKGDKHDSKRLKWIQKAVSKDTARPTLTGFHVKDNNISGTDGYRAFTTKAPNGLSDYDDKILYGKIPTGDFITELDEIVGKYPDLTSLVSLDQPVAQFAVNPKYLADALSIMDGSVRIATWGENQPIELYGNDKEGIACHVILMPMHMGDGTMGRWNPFITDEQRKPAAIED